MVTAARIAAVAQISQSYSPGGANVHPHVITRAHASRPPNGIAVSSAVFQELPACLTQTYSREPKALERRWRLR